VFSKTSSMNRYWEKKRDKFKVKYSEITNNDLDYKEGNENELLKTLGLKLGKTEMEMISIIIEF